MCGGINVERISPHFSRENFCGPRVAATPSAESVRRRFNFRLREGALKSRCSVQTLNKEDTSPGGQTLVVVGGGAAGVYGALRAKSLCPGLKVVVLEKGQLLSKVRVSGGGRCNLTTGLFNDPLLLAGQYPRGHKELRGSYFHTHGPQDTAAWFVKRGVALKTESDGRVFPKSDSSATIIDCLLSEARSVGVTLQTSVQVSGISKKGGKFTVQVKDQRSHGRSTVEAEYVLLATGSAPQGYEIALRLGHSIVEPRPSLFTFQVKDSALTELSGISFENVRANLKLPDQKLNGSNLTQEGPLLVTHWGFSGPVVLRLSAWAARLLYSSGYEGTLWLDFSLRFGLEETKSMLVKHKQEHQKRNLGSFVPADLPLMRRFWLYLLQRLGLDKDSKWARLPTRSLYDLAALIKRCPFEISGKGVFKDEFVTAGGVPLVEIDLQTMESKKCPGLFLAGEVVNVDGVTGGFNFQNAWTGGYIAGTTVAKQIDCAKSLLY